MIEDADPTKVFNFEYTRVCVECQKVKTLTYFGRRSLEQWFEIIKAELKEDHVCESCREL